MIVSPWVVTSLFLCGAALSLLSATAGALLSMWCAHVARTGCNPLPTMPKIRLFGRRVADDDDDETTNNHPPAQRRVGP